MYKNKYLKYKQKYLNLKMQYGGADDIKKEVWNINTWKPNKSAETYTYFDEINTIIKNHGTLVMESDDEKKIIPRS